MRGEATRDLGSTAKLRASVRLARPHPDQSETPMPARRDQDFFWEGVDRGELLVQECIGCGKLRHPPSPLCATCCSPEWKPRRLAGRGRIHTWIVSRHPSQPDPEPQLVILVELEEGLRFVSILVDAENASTGASVALEFGDVHGKRLPIFRTVGAPAAGG
jgi:uncharacterized OB-fold protein